MSETSTSRWSELPHDIPLLLTTNETASLLGVTPKHVRTLLADGRLKGVRIGTSWRVNRDAALALAGLSD